MLHEAHHPEDLFFELLGGAVDVRVVLREVAHAEQAVQHAAHLVAVHAAELGHAQRQVAVGAPSALVDEQAAGAVHRLHRVRLLVDLGEVHVLLVVVPVAAALPQLAAQDHRGADLLVAGAHVLGAPEVDHRVPEAHALGVEEREPRPLLVEAEEVEVAADAAVIALASELERLEVRRQLVFAREGGAVDSREHRVLLVAAPVGAGEAGELEGAAAELVGARQVRAATEVDEVALAIDADRRDLVAGRLGGGHEVVDELDLEGLVETGRQAGGARAGRAGPEHRERLVDGQFVALHRQVLAHDLAHLLLDARQVGLADGLGELEVVVEAVLDGRPNGVLRAREEADDGLRHHVRGGVTQDVDGVGVLALERDDVEAVAVLERCDRVHEEGHVRVGGGGHAARDGGLRQPRADRRRRVAHGRAVVEFQGGAVGKGDVQRHEGPVLSHLRARAPCGGC